MPGYRPLEGDKEGFAIPEALAAEARVQEGDLDAAAALLEEALRACLATNPEMPGWLCGRLAVLYRVLGRYDDEVDLIERYRDSQRNEEGRARYDARLSKARAVAEKHRRSDSGALASIRLIRASRRNNGHSPRD